MKKIEILRLVSFSYLATYAQSEHNILKYGVEDHEIQFNLLLNISLDNKSGIQIET